MVTVKLPADVHAALKILAKRQKGTIADGLRVFLEDTDPELMAAGKKVAALQDEAAAVGATGQEGRAVGENGGARDLGAPGQHRRGPDAN